MQTLVAKQKTKVTTAAPASELTTNNGAVWMIGYLEFEPRPYALLCSRIFYAGYRVIHHILSAGRTIPKRSAYQPGVFHLPPALLLFRLLSAREHQSQLLASTLHPLLR